MENIYIQGNGSYIASPWNTCGNTGNFPRGKTWGTDSSSEKHGVLTGQRMGQHGRHMVDFKANECHKLTIFMLDPE